MPLPPVTASDAGDLLAAMLSYAPLTLAPVLLLLLAPHAGARTRSVLAGGLAAAAVALLVLAATRSGSDAELDVINPFLNPERGGPVPFVVERVTAPAWHWPAVAGGLLLLAAATLFVLRRRPTGAPAPVRYAFVVTLWTLAARLTLEKSAAPEALTWAIGVTVPTVLVLPFFGAWNGVRGRSWRGLIAALLLLAFLQRSLIIALGWLATTQGLGTHLDVGAIREVTLPLGHRDFTGPGDQTTAQWVSLLLVPQYLLWIPATVVAGLVLGGVPFAVARRRGAPRGSDS